MELFRARRTCSTAAMWLDVAITSVLLGIGYVIFHPFEAHTALWLRVMKVVIALGLVALISRRWGRRWALGLVVVWLTVALCFHGWWTWSHGINFFRPEPKAKYYQLRGWKLEPEAGAP